MMANCLLILTPVLLGVITAEYVGPQNGNGNAYGVPTDSITPPQGPSGPYPPSGWKPAGRRLLLPGESRGAQQPVDSSYGQPPTSQYGPAVNPPPINNQYGPSVDNTGPPNNQYIPGSGSGGFGNGNGFSNGNGHNGNGNGNGHNGNGNGHNGNGNGHNGNGNGHNGNGNGHNGNGNGHNGNGNGHNGNGNGHNGNGNGHNGNGNGHNGNGNGHNGNGNGHNGGNGNGFANGNGQNGFGNGLNGNGHNGNGGANGNGNGKGGNGANGLNGLVPAFHGSFPGGLIYPFVQHSVPAVLAFRPGNGAGSGHIYPIFQVPISHASPGTGIIASSIPNDIGTGQGVFPVTGAFPSFQTSSGTPDLTAAHPGIQVTGTQDVAAAYPGVVGQGGGLYGSALGQYFTFLSNAHSHKSHTLGVNNGLTTNLQLQSAVGHSAYGNGGVPLAVF